MSSYTERLQWRRNKVLELSSEGRSQPQIASILHIALGTINRDLQILRQRARKNISKYIDEILPLEYQKCLIGIDTILTKTWDITNDSNTLERDRLQASSVGMQAYGMKINLLTNANVIEKAVQFIDRNRGYIKQNSEVQTDDTTGSIENNR